MEGRYINTRKKGYMHTVTLPNYQIETKDELHVVHDKQEATKLFHTYVVQRIPCEFFKDGIKQNEFKIQ